MNKPLVNVTLMIVLGMVTTFSSAADEGYELPKFGNVIAILTGFIGESCDKPKGIDEVSQQSKTMVNK
ncbi:MULTISPECIES: hypothetical protein [Pseudomonas]|uniref:hypothetical protein n=1 Tax=Pseudomonas TaxID=286 RepID=UPI00109E228E|nr:MULTISPECIES: hypothetical protein [Pseudomonas]EKV1241286.1 hypothetical protein [Pseudomonas aeruginosa]EKV8586195.1 hypothetical protein [Pseudomonas aeruginosa]ELN5407413.1 hypothetical protein [Pseudomonas aeruginosa]ELP1438604.1 hypothetical protein [Pseudomonas aeruginosa]THB16439.1 hypothetical protein E6W26_29010 [Pseudomonas aeruginosa]